MGYKNVLDIDELYKNNKCRDCGIDLPKDFNDDICLRCEKLRTDEDIRVDENE